MKRREPPAGCNGPASSLGGATERSPRTDLGILHGHLVGDYVPMLPPRDGDRGSPNRWSEPASTLGGQGRGISVAPVGPCPPSGEILDACCGGRHWWWDKAHPLAVYMDERVAPKGSVDVRPNWECSPDLVGDFRAMPFEDESFNLVLFDPPHIVRDNASGYIATKYGALAPDSEQEDLRRGFTECWRVLAAGGTLVFKWGAGSLKRVEPHFPATPIVGTRSPRGGQTRWFIFYKPHLGRNRDATHALC